MIERPEGLEFWLGAVSDVEIADIIGCSVSIVRVWRLRVGAKSNGRSTWARHKDPKYAKFSENVSKELLRCQSVKAVAEKFKCSRQHVIHSANVGGVVYKGQWVGPTKLSPISNCTP